MKKNDFHKNGFSFLGAVILFVAIAFVIQIAVLVFDYINQKTSDTGVIAVTMLIVIIVLSAICTLVDYIRRKITVNKPIEEILDATEKISRGDFNVRLTPSRPYGKYSGYDIIKLNVNVMAEELSKSEILKTDFISNVSHELKTPLSVIRNYAYLLKSNDLSLEDKQKYLEVITGATERLSELINNILKLNKLENSEFGFDKEKFSLTQNLETAVLNFEDKIEKKQLNLQCDFDDVIINSCSSQLEIVWNNLISNAVKFTPNGGTITIKLKKNGNKAVVSVSDTGIGISEESGAKIFDKFYQADTSRSSEGNGLGLALVKKVIDVIGGEISVSSVLNEGATFTVTLSGVDDD